MIDETPWQRNKAVSYSLPVNHACQDMMGLPVMELCCWHSPTVSHETKHMRLPGREQMWCYSLPVYRQWNYLAFNGQK